MFCSIRFATGTCEGSTYNIFYTYVILQGTQYHNAVQKFIDVCKLNEQPEGDDDTL